VREPATVVQLGAPAAEAVHAAWTAWARGRREAS
jgi:hypothetical protein